MSSEPPSVRRPRGRPLETVLLARTWIRDVLSWASGHSEDSFFKNPMALAATQRALAALGEALKDLPADILSREPDSMG